MSIYLRVLLREIYVILVMEAHRGGCLSRNTFCWMQMAYNQWDLTAYNKGYFDLQVGFYIRGITDVVHT